MIKSMFGALALFIFLLVVPVSGQVDISTGLRPSDTALAAENDWSSAVKLLDYMMQSAGQSACVSDEIGEDAWGALGVLCVFNDPVEDRKILFATVDGGMQIDYIFAFRDRELISVAHAADAFDDATLILHDLEPGNYEVMFRSGDTSRTSFWFLIFEPSGGD